VLERNRERWDELKRRRDSGEAYITTDADGREYVDGVLDETRIDRAVQDYDQWEGIYRKLRKQAEAEGRMEPLAAAEEAAAPSGAPVLRPVETGAREEGRAQAAAREAGQRGDQARERVLTKEAKPAEQNLRQQTRRALRARNEAPVPRTIADAVRTVREVRRDVTRQVRERVLGQVLDDLSAFGGEKLEYLPAMRRGESQAAWEARTGLNAASYEWYFDLSKSEQARIRQNWMVRRGEEGGVTPDVMAASLEGNRGLGGGEWEGQVSGNAGEEWLRLTREADAAKRVASNRRGRMSTLAEDIDVLSTRLEDLGLDPEEARVVFADGDARTVGVELRDLRERMGAERAAVAREVMDQPWDEVKRDRAAGDLAGIFDDDDAWAADNPGQPAPDSAWRIFDEDEVIALEDAGVGAPGNVAWWEAAARKVRGEPILFGEERLTWLRDELRRMDATPLDAEETAFRDWVAKWVDQADPASAAQRALTASEERVADAYSRRSVEGLTRAERTLYRQLAADERLGQVRGSQAERRAAAVDTLTERGRRQGEREGLATGRLEGAATEAESQSRRAARTAETELKRAAGDDRYAANSRVTAAILSPAIKKARRAGELEMAARVAERDAIRAERRATRLIERQSADEVAARGSPEAVPARIGEMSRVVGNARAAVHNIADRLEAEWLDALDDDQRGAHARGELEPPGIVTMMRGLIPDIEQSTQRLAALEPEGGAVHMIGGLTEAPIIGEGPRGGWRSRLGEKLPPLIKTTQERRKTRTTGNVEWTPRGQALRHMELVRDGVGNATANQLLGEFGTKAVRDADGTVRMVDARTAVDEGATLTGPEAEAWMAKQQRPYVAWNPRSLFDTVKGEQIGPETVFIPKHVFERFRKTFGPASWIEQGFRKYWDRGIMAGLRVSWLALSGQWATGNMAGNAMMATFGAGMRPDELVSYMVEARRLVKAGDPEGRLPRRLFGRGFARDEARFGHPNYEMWLDPDTARKWSGGTNAPHAANVPGRIAARSFAMNEYVDNVTRSAIFLQKRAKGLSEEEAIHSALNAAGDFSRMTSVERQVVKRALPFYSWLRHITKLTLRLPIEHPMRVVWALHLADWYAPEASKGDLPPHLIGAIPMGKDRWIPLAFANPFLGANLGGAGVPASPLIDPTEAVANVNPVVGWAGAAFFGFDVGQMEPLGRPAGTEKLDEYGNPTITPLFLPLPFGRHGRVNPREAAWYFANEFPQGRLATGLIAGSQARYETGYPVKTATGTMDTGRSRESQVARFAGVPFVPVTSSVEEFQAKRDQRLLRHQDEARRYFEGYGGSSSSGRGGARGGARSGARTGGR
jgi:hypothetical protein